MSIVLADNGSTDGSVEEAERHWPGVLLVRTGHLALCRDRKSWGDYAGGDAPGLSLETAEWVHARQLAAVATDTWGMKVRPHKVTETIHPLHQIFLTQMGLLIGEIFDLEELAADCAADGVYEVFFAAPPLPTDTTRWRFMPPRPEVER